MVHEALRASQLVTAQPVAVDRLESQCASCGEVLRVENEDPLVGEPVPPRPLPWLPPAGRHGTRRRRCPPRPRPGRQQGDVTAGEQQEGGQEGGEHGPGPRRAHGSISCRARTCLQAVLRVRLRVLTLQTHAAPEGCSGFTRCGHPVALAARTVIPSQGQEGRRADVPSMACSHVELRRLAAPPGSYG